jgi:hypothetical protein
MAIASFTLLLGTTLITLRYRERTPLPLEILTAAGISGV